MKASLKPNRKVHPNCGIYRDKGPTKVEKSTYKIGRHTIIEGSKARPGISL
jgi:hypothetical protein